MCCCCHLCTLRIFFYRNGCFFATLSWASSCSQRCSSCSRSSKITACRSSSVVTQTGKHWLYRWQLVPGHRARHEAQPCPMQAHRALFQAAGLGSPATHVLLPAEAHCDDNEVVIQSLYSHHTVIAHMIITQASYRQHTDIIRQKNSHHTVSHRHRTAIIHTS